VQWSFGAQPVKLGGNPAGYRVFTGFRVSGSRAFFEWTSSAEKKDRETFYAARDAFNGLPLWTLKEKASFGRKEWQFVAVADRLYTFLEPAGPLVALDAATGQIARTFDQGGRLTDEVNLTAVRVCEATVVESASDTIYALDRTTGELRWKHTEEKSLILFPSVSPRENKVFAVVAEDRKQGAFNRWPYIRAVAVVCMDLATGRILWRNVDVAGSDIGQLVYAEGSLALFGSGAIGGSKDPYIGRIDVSTGKLLWHTTFKTAYNRFGYNLLVRDGTMYYADAWRIYALDMKTGEETRTFDDGGYNMRCNRFSATDDWLIYGYVAFVDKKWGGLYQSVTRGGCAQGSVPANGMMYFTPQACGCFTMLRGHLALSSEPLREPISDAERLEKGPFLREPVPAARGTLPAGPVAGDWVKPARSLIGRSQGEEGSALETEPVSAEGKTFVALIHEHRMEARDSAGRPVWSVTAGGRISGPPLVRDGLCFFGSHDGWVYAVRVEDGILAWRFRAAPYERKYMSNNQIESSWPIFGVTLHEGLLCFSAGLHPEVGGGIYAYGVEPATGKLTWKKVIRKAPVVLEGTVKRPPPIVPNRILNDAIRSEGGALVLPGLTFTPGTTDEELKRKIEAPIPKKK
jgi:outer membrane protein assembly factor BamB